MVLVHMPFSPPSSNNIFRTTPATQHLATSSATCASQFTNPKIWMWALSKVRSDKGGLLPASFTLSTHDHLWCTCHWVTVLYSFSDFRCFKWPTSVVMKWCWELLFTRRLWCPFLRKTHLSHKFCSGTSYTVVDHKLIVNKLAVYN